MLNFMNRAGEKRDSQAAEAMRSANHGEMSGILNKMQEALVSLCDWQQSINESIKIIAKELAEIKCLLQKDAQRYLPQEDASPDENLTEGMEKAALQGQMSMRALYAGACSNGIFTSVTAEPVQGKTIYQLFLEGTDRARFEVYQGAMQKVVQDSNFLMEACKMEGRGFRLQTKKKGFAQNDGSIWRLVDPAQVEFY